jgi:hypothetical protein
MHNSNGSGFKKDHCSTVNELALKILITFAKKS